MFRVKLAESAVELEGVYRARHRVLAEEEGSWPTRRDGRIHDHWDSYPGTANFVAVVAGQVVGNFRFVRDGALGSPADEYFDFAGHLPEAARPPVGQLGTAGFLCVWRAARVHTRLTFAMMALGYSWSVAHGLTHLKAGANPERLAMLEAAGWRAIAPQFHDEKHGLPVVPILFDLSRMGARFEQFMRWHRAELGFRSFERQFHAAGDDVFTGAIAGEQVIVVAGTLRLERDRRALATFGPGDHVGELDVLRTQSRATALIATEDVDLLIVPRAAFLTQLAANPALADRVAGSLVSRWADMLAA